MFLQLIVLSLKVYWPAVTATSILSFTVHYLELIDPLTMSVVYLYKKTTIYTTDEKEITIQTPEEFWNDQVCSTFAWIPQE